RSLQTSPLFPYTTLFRSIVLVLVALAIGALNLLRWGPRLRAGIRARTALIRDTMAETGIFIVIIVAASVLTALAPPAQPSASARSEERRVGKEGRRGRWR